MHQGRMAVRRQPLDERFNTLKSLPTPEVQPVPWSDLAQFTLDLLPDSPPENHAFEERSALQLRPILVCHSVANLAPHLLIFITLFDAMPSIRDDLVILLLYHMTLREAKRYGPSSKGGQHQYVRAANQCFASRIERAIAVISPGDIRG
jgi:hypothetical protein